MEYYRIKYFKNEEYIKRCVKLLKPLWVEIDINKSEEYLETGF